MIELPPGVGRAWVSWPTGRHPNRPWWSRSHTSAVFDAARKDHTIYSRVARSTDRAAGSGRRISLLLEVHTYREPGEDADKLVILVLPHPSHSGPAPGPIAAAQFGTVEGALAYLDAEYPTQRPEPSEGQIWYVPRAAARGVNAEQGWVLVTLQHAIEPDEWMVGGYRYRTSQLIQALERGALVHDPLFPDQAPWSREALQTTPRPEVG